MAFFVWVLALAITSLIVLIYIYQKMGGSRWRRQVRKHRRVRVDHQRLRKHPSKKTEHRMPGPVYVEQPWLTECLSQGDCYFKCGQWRKEKPAHHMRRPLSVQDLWLALGLGGFLPEHERWLQEFLCGMMRPMLARFMHSLQKRNGASTANSSPVHHQGRTDPTLLCGDRP
ncbi:uncharacterized protein LOC128335292 isoform X4 [Hemicordylus capensis]|uniref:uncharacterized protein LOC128335292 isoform X4 n=1 Tax=Hemicordylus capensis TaxID=884348 RepID=UPI002304C3FF|nr:uncharacterized protein LOC128335292 isoform X4 [Hemicordylus capensis]